jgi:hypothetical protein
MEVLEYAIPDQSKRNLLLGRLAAGSWLAFAIETLEKPLAQSAARR